MFRPAGRRRWRDTSATTPGINNANATRRESRQPRRTDRSTNPRNRAFLPAGPTVDAAIQRAASAQHDAPGQRRNTTRVRAAKRSSTARPCHSSSSRANNCPIASVPSFQAGSLPTTGTLRRATHRNRTSTAHTSQEIRPAGRRRRTRHRRPIPRTPTRADARSTDHRGRSPAAGSVRSGGRTGPGQRWFPVVLGQRTEPDPRCSMTGTRTTHTTRAGDVRPRVGEWSPGRHGPSVGRPPTAPGSPVGSTCTPTTATGGRNRTARPTPSLRVGR